MSAIRCSGMLILDGSLLRVMLANDSEFRGCLKKEFDSLDSDGSGRLSRAELRPAFLRVAALLGLPPPGSKEELDLFVEAMFLVNKEVEGEDGKGGLTVEEFTEATREILTELQAILEVDPVVVSVFNGALLRDLLSSSPSTIDHIVSKAFASLDVDSSGTLSKAELLPLLQGIGQEQGMPPTEAAGDLLDSLLQQYGKEGEQELDRSQFTRLLTDVLTATADELQRSPLLVPQNAVVLNGSTIRKLLSDDATFEREADSLFVQWDISNRGRLTRSDITTGLQRLGLAIGLPPPPAPKNASERAKAEAMDSAYSALFSAADVDQSGFVERGEFSALLKALLSAIAEQLQRNPLVVEVKVVSQEGGTSSDGGEVLDGSKLQQLMLNEEEFDRFLNDKFDKLDVDKSGRLSRDELRPAFLKLGELLGLPPPGTQREVDAYVDSIFRGVVSEDLSEEVERERFVTTAKEILKGIAATLEEDPFFTITMDGSRLKSMLASEAKVKKLVDDMFSLLDTDGSGELSAQELLPAIQEFAAALGIPETGVNSEADIMVEAAVKVYGEGKKELSKDQFAILLVDILTDISDRLATNPVVLASSATVFNGSKIKKLLSNDADFQQFSTEVFSDWDVKRRGRLNQSELAAGIKKLGAAFGLPPPAAKDADKFYRDLFVSADMDDSGFVDKQELGELLRSIFKQLVEQLEKNPVVVESTLLLD